MSVDELEKMLRPIDNPMAPFPAKVITLKSGRLMTIRQIGREEIPQLLPHVEKLIHLDRDFYDIVAARLYAELLGWYRYRVADEYVLVAQVDGELAAIVNGRMLNKDVGVSYHTMTFLRGERVGSHAFATKMEYHLEYLKQKEVLIVAESPIGFGRWMEEYKLEKRFEIAHELGGAPSWALTIPLYEKAKKTLVQGTRPVPPELLAKAKRAIFPPSNPPGASGDFAPTSKGTSKGASARA
ncbi:MAG: hypothetical protein V1798_10945 [Pseudomonadota bacterium]